jgi:hypothetical protein
VAHCGWETVLNRRGTTAQAERRGASQRKDAASAQVLMQQHPSSSNARWWSGRWPRSADHGGMGRARMAQHASAMQNVQTAQFLTYLYLETARRYLAPINFSTVWRVMESTRFPGGYGEKAIAFTVWRPPPHWPAHRNKPACSATPIVQQVAIPRQVCTNETVYTGQRTTGGGAVLGAIAGGAAGNAVGKGSGRAAATATRDRRRRAGQPHRGPGPPPV